MSFWTAASSTAKKYGADGCLQFAAGAYASGSYRIPGPYGSNVTAYSWWNANKSRQVRVKIINAPRGALVFWGDTLAGHVVVSVGNGYAVSTNERTAYQVHFISIASRNKTRPEELGYIMP